MGCLQGWQGYYYKEENCMMMYGLQDLAHDDMELQWTQTNADYFEDTFKEKIAMYTQNRQYIGSKFLDVQRVGGSQYAIPNHMLGSTTIIILYDGFGIFAIMGYVILQGTSMLDEG